MSKVCEALLKPKAYLLCLAFIAWITSQQSIRKLNFDTFVGIYAEDKAEAETLVNANVSTWATSSPSSVATTSHNVSAFHCQGNAQNFKNVAVDRRRQCSGTRGGRRSTNGRRNETKNRQRNGKTFNVNVLSTNVKWPFGSVRGSAENKTHKRRVEAARVSKVGDKSQNKMRPKNTSN